MSQTPEVICGEAVINNARGLHARASARFAKCASGFDAKVLVKTAGQSAPAESIMELLMLAAGKGTHLKLSGEGAQAKQAVTTLCALIEDGFGENG